MISVAEARARMLTPLRTVGAEIVALADSWQRVTAAPILARLTQPPADLSAMDGYAMRMAGAGAVLRVIGTAPAGHPFAGTLGVGEAVRLFTGSVIPAGAETVLIQENAAREGDTVRILAAPSPGRHIRRAGQDFAVGDALVAAQRRITARDVALAAAGNAPWIAVRRRPRVALLSTGDEIVLPGEAVAPGGIVSANAHALAALVRAAGGIASVLPIVADERDAIARAGAAAAGADLLVTTGGASVGDHDLLAEGLASNGLTLDFWTIAMRPGKPVLFGSMGPLPVIGLPGNPVAALVCGLLFVRPMIERLLGLPGDAPVVEPARLGAALPANDYRADHLRATLASGQAGDLPVATAFPRQDSAMLTTLAGADALILRPPLAAAAALGSVVDIIRLAQFGM